MKVGFVGLAGRPNVGKSSLINAIFGRKVVIVTEKPQTTRNRINVIYNDKDSQIIFVDTPGIHRPLHRFGEFMVKAATAALKGVDIILFVLDGERGWGEPEDNIADIINKSEAKTIIDVNKMDLVEMEDAKVLMEKTKSKIKNIIGEVFTSAKTGKGISELLQLIKDNLEEGVKFYPEDMVTDRPLSFMAAELIREKIFLLTREEVPHSTAVIVEEVKERKNGVLYIRANIYVERNSQKGILIGKGGQMIKQIGSMARRELEFLTDRKVYLDLFVKVKEKWREKDFIILNEIGMRDEIE
ncbi:MAG: GTPase Era [Thermotogaceae bacterium]|nr:GTPase Era [Thermotogaceae bacterium]